jgi:hypothetical protein
MVDTLDQNEKDEIREKLMNSSIQKEELERQFLSQVDNLKRISNYTAGGGSGAVSNNTMRITNNNYYGQDPYSSNRDYNNIDPNVFEKNLYNNTYDLENVGEINKSEEQEYNNII